MLNRPEEVVLKSFKRPNFHSEEIICAIARDCIIRRMHMSVRRPEGTTTLADLTDRHVVSRRASAGFA